MQRWVLPLALLIALMIPLGSGCRMDDQASRSEFLKQSLEEGSRNATHFSATMEKVLYGCGAVVALGVLYLVVCAARTVVVVPSFTLSRRGGKAVVRNSLHVGGEGVREFGAGRWGVTVGIAAQEQAQTAGAMPRVSDPTCLDVVRLEPIDSPPDSSSLPILYGALTCNKCTREFDFDIILAGLGSFTKHCSCGNCIEGQVNPDRAAGATYVVVYPKLVSLGGGGRRPRLRLTDIRWSDK